MKRVIGTNVIARLTAVFWLSRERKTRLRAGTHGRFPEVSHDMIIALSFIAAGVAGGLGWLYVTHAAPRLPRLGDATGRLAVGAALYVGWFQLSDVMYRTLGCVGQSALAVPHTSGFYVVVCAIVIVVSAALRAVPRDSANTASTWFLILGLALGLGVLTGAVLSEPWNQVCVFQAVPGPSPAP